LASISASRSSTIFVGVERHDRVEDEREAPGVLRADLVARPMVAAGLALVVRPRDQFLRTAWQLIPEIVASAREKSMIGRVWHGWASAENADACEALIKSEMLPGPAARTVPGFERVELSKSDFGDEVEFMVITWFPSWEATKAFAGEEFERARVPANLRALLSRFDELSQHYEIRMQVSGVRASVLRSPPNPATEDVRARKRWRAFRRPAASRDVAAVLGARVAASPASRRAVP
jgi:hypothetical protein